MNLALHGRKLSAAITLVTLALSALFLAQGTTSLIAGSLLPPQPVATSQGPKGKIEQPPGAEPPDTHELLKRNIFDPTVGPRVDGVYYSDGSFSNLTPKAFFKNNDPTPSISQLYVTDHNPFVAHAEVELGIDPQELANPWQAALSSALAFTVGALLPLIAILAPPTSVRIPVTVVAVLLALMVTGAVSAGMGGAPRGRAVARNVVGGGLALAITYAIGHVVGVAIA